MTVTWRIGPHTDRHQEIPCLNYYFPSGPAPRYIIIARPDPHPQPGSRRRGRTERAPRGRPISPEVGRRAWRSRGAPRSAAARLSHGSQSGGKMAERRLHLQPATAFPGRQRVPFPRPPSAVRLSRGLGKRGRVSPRAARSAGCQRSGGKSQPPGPPAVLPLGRDPVPRGSGKGALGAARPPPPPPAAAGPAPGRGFSPPPRPAPRAGPAPPRGGRWAGLRKATARLRVAAAGARAEPEVGRAAAAAMSFLIDSSIMVTSQVPRYCAARRRPGGVGVGVGRGRGGSRRSLAQPAVRPGSGRWECLGGRCLGARACAPPGARGAGSPGAGCGGAVPERRRRRQRQRQRPALPCRAAQLPPAVLAPLLGPPRPRLPSGGNGSVPGRVRRRPPLGSEGGKNPLVAASVGVLGRRFVT